MSKGRYKDELQSILKREIDFVPDSNKKVDIIREHKNIKPLFLKMIKKDIIYV